LFIDSTVSFKSSNFSIRTKKLGVTTIIFEQVSILVSLPLFLTSGQTLWLTLIFIPTISMSLVGNKIDPEIMSLSTGKNIFSDITSKEVVSHTLWCYGMRFLPSVAILSIGHLVKILFLITQIKLHFSFTLLKRCLFCIINDWELDLRQKIIVYFLGIILNAFLSQLQSAIHESSASKIKFFSKVQYSFLSYWGLPSKALCRIYKFRVILLFSLPSTILPVHHWTFQTRLCHVKITRLIPSGGLWTLTWIWFGQRCS